MNESKSSAADLAMKKAEHAPPFLVCLARLLELQGKKISLAALCSGLPIDAEEADPGECLRVVERFGMDSSLVRRKSLSNIEPLTLPSILILINGRACILTKLDDTAAEVIFPETKSQKVSLSLSELEESYAGYIAYCKPRTVADARAAAPRTINTKRWFWGTLFKFWPIYQHVLLATIVINLLALASPLFVMNVYDRVVPNDAIETLWVLAIGVMIAYGFDFVLRNLRGYFVETAGRSADILVASKLLHHLMAIRLDCKTGSSGSLANNLRDFESLREFFSSATFVALLDLPFIVIFIGIIAYVGGPVAVVPAVAVPLVVLVGLFVQLPFRQSILAGFQESAQKNALMIEVLHNLETIKTTLAEGALQRKWERIIGMHARSSARSQSLVNFSTSFTVWSAQMVSAGVIIWGVYRISDGELTMGGLIACNILAGRAMAPLGSVASMLTKLQQSRISLAALDSLMRTPVERSSQSEPLSSESLAGTVRFDNVSFTYPEGGREVLQNLKLDIPAGAKVGIIGKVGSGKSTIGKLLVRLYTPQKGQITLGDVDLNQLDPADIRNDIGYVAQESRLFYGSIRENLLMGNPHVDDHLMIRVSKLTGLEGYVKTQPAGYDTQVGENGQKLSGGQRQFISLTRALLKTPKVMVLDEPTGSLDSFSEQQLRNNLIHELRDTTLLLITHRHSMLAMVDQLAVVDAGKIVAYGPKEKVLTSLREGKIRTSSIQ